MFFLVSDRRSGCLDTQVAVGQEAAERLTALSASNLARPDTRRNPPPYPEGVYTSSTRDRSRLDSTRALARAALRLVERDGFDEVTVDAIAAEAGVSRRTFFNHFPTKAAALFDPDPDDARRLSALLDAADGTSSPWAGLRVVCTTFVGGHEDVIAVRRRLVALSPELDQYHRTAHRHVEVALREWALRQPSADPYLADLMASTAATVMITAFSTWQAHHDPVERVELVDRGSARVENGFDTGAARPGPA